MMVKNYPNREASFTLAQVAWWVIFAISIGFYFISAWVYYRMLRTEPFLGSTVAPSVSGLGSVRIGLARFGLSLGTYAAILGLAARRLVAELGVTPLAPEWRTLGKGPAEWEGRSLEHLVIQKLS